MTDQTGHIINKVVGVKARRFDGYGFMCQGLH